MRHLTHDMRYLIDDTSHSTSHSTSHITSHITCHISYMRCPHYSVCNTPYICILTTRYVIPHTSISHTSISHTSISHTSISHTSISHTFIPHTSISHTFIPHTFIPYIRISIHLHLSSSMRGQSRMGATSHLNESKPLARLRIHTDVYMYLCIHMYIKDIW